MAGFLTTDYSNNTGGNYDPLPTGTYEMIINNAHEDATKNGAETLQIDLLVRNDLDKVPGLAETNAKYHNRHVFSDNWKSKDTNQYNLEGFQYILEAAKVPEGTPVKTVEDFMNLIKGAAVKVYVKQEPNTYNGKTNQVNRVAPWGYGVTDFPEVQHSYKTGSKPTSNQAPAAAPAGNNNVDPFANSGQPIDIDDSDLPF